MTVPIDGWTGHTFGAQNTKIIALSRSKSYLLRSDRNSDYSDSTDSYLFPLLQQRIKFVLAKGIAVCGITTDNAMSRNEKKLRLDLRKSQQAAG